MEWWNESRIFNCKFNIIIWNALCQVFKALKKHHNAYFAAFQQIIVANLLWWNKKEPAQTDRFLFQFRSSAYIFLLNILSAINSGIFSAAKMIQNSNPHKFISTNSPNPHKLYHGNHEVN